MQLDRTAIVISQRSADELFDLSLVVLRCYATRILPLAILGVLPFALINYVLLRPLTDFEQLVMASRDFATIEGFRVRYLWTMVCMVFLQTPLAMCGVTYFLGQAVFIEQPTLRQVVGVVRQRWFSLFLVLGILRCGLLSILFSAWIAMNPVLYPELLPLIYLVLATIAVFLIRSFRPFAPEILLLERCPLRKQRSAAGTEQSYAKRSAWLHAGSGDLFSVSMGLAFVSVLFLLTMCMGSLFLVGVLVGYWNWGWWMDVLFFPLVLWLMALWGTVIGFLLYLNTRIRLEGWEVYLKLNAELQRMVEST